MTPAAGNYIRYDLNMPKSLPKRPGGPRDYEQDSPLTTQGHFQANLVGKLPTHRYFLGTFSTSLSVI